MNYSVQEKWIRKEIWKKNISSILGAVVFYFVLTYFHFQDDKLNIFLILFIPLLFNIIIDFFVKNIVLLNIEINGENYIITAYRPIKGVHQIIINKQNILKVDFSKVNQLKIKYKEDNLTEKIKFKIEVYCLEDIYRKIREFKANIEAENRQNLLIKE